ncbi:hypothetical protein Tco_0738592 [Tanacetum coccineum]
MHQFWHTITKIKNSSSYKFKLDKKKCNIDVEVFCDILQICPRLPNQEFDELPSQEEIVTFIKELGHKSDIKSITDVVIDQMHQPWRTFASIINKCQSGKITGLDKIRLSRAQILWGMFYNKNVDFVELLWEDFVFQLDKRDHKKQEKMYYPRFTKVIIYYFISKDKSISMRNKIFMHTVHDDSVLGAETPNKARKFKKPASSYKKKTLVAVEEPAEKPTKKPATRRQSTRVQIRDTPGVSASKKKAPAKTERSKGIELLSDATLLEEAYDEEDDEFVHTPEDYVPTNDEDVNDEEFDRINKEMYSDVNMELKDSKRKGEGKDDEEMTDVGQVDADHEEVSQEVAVTESSTAPATTITSLFSSLFPNLQQSTPIPSPTTTEATTSPLILTICATVKSEVPNVVKEYIGTSLDDALHKALQRYTAKLIKKHFIPADVTDHKALYHALMESILKDEDAMDRGVTDKLKKRKLDDDRDEGPPSAQAEETVFEAGDTQVPQNLGEDMGNTDEPPVVNVYPKDWFKKPKRPPTLDPEWNEGKSVENKPTQKWICDLAKAEKPSKPFDDLMSPPIDFSAFVMNRQ